MNDAPAVIIEQATFTYPGGREPALVDVSLQLQPGTLTVISGRTGSGKSTLLKLLAGWIPRYSSGTLTGSAELVGHDVHDKLPPGLIGYVLQSPDDQICTTSVESEVTFGLENLCLPHDEIKRRLDDALALCELTDVIDRHPQQLSGGQKQRLILAATLAMQPRLIVLDEPLSQLDPAAAHELIELLAKLKQQGLTLVVAEHRLHELLPIADQRVTIENGRLIDVPRDCQPLRATAAQFAASDELPVAAAIANLSFTHPRAQSPVWHDVSFVLRAGERTALVGPNGSGKSTLLAVLASVRHPNSDNRVLNFAPNGVPWGLVPQNPDLLLFNATVFDELVYTLRRLRWSPEQITERVLYLADALALADKLAEPPQSLSQGQRLRVVVGAMLAARPHVLLLDEPTTGQDPDQVSRLMQTVTQEMAFGPSAKHGLRSVLFSTHDRRIIAQFADRVLVLANGKLAADVTVEQFLTSEALQRLASWGSANSRRAS
ncbi:MAG: ABC transporter ATP-binding protein [Planctomycetaceae bacterium]|nr:ABC transporter ATP-binding protein [Planctomycetaceae bacterium]